MPQEALSYEAEDLMGSIYDPNWFRDHEEHFEQYWEWPDFLGHGFLSVVKPRAGLLLSMGAYQLRHPVEVGFTCGHSPITFGFSISGEMYLDTQYGGKKTRVWRLRQGQSMLGYQPAQRGVTGHAMVGVPMRCVCVSVEPWLLRRLMADKAQRPPEGLRALLEPSDRQMHCRTRIMTPASMAIIHQILHCPYQAPLKRVYLEGKALELITVTMEQYIEQEPPPEQAPALHPHDLACARHARRLVDEQYQNPPTLQELARFVGLPHTKLNLYFREVYGTTIFGYLREVRLNMAKSLLDAGSMNVTEVAFESGYSSLSHFTKTFRDHFGVTPGKYLRNAYRTPHAVTALNS